MNAQTNARIGSLVGWMLSQGVPAAYDDFRSGDKRSPVQHKQHRKRVARNRIAKASRRRNR